MAEKIDRKKYPSFGECIYCGALATDTKLTDEHIIPFSLGGNALIVDGSCLSCADETKKIEQELGRNAFWDFRAHIGEQTRRKKDRPKELSFVVSINGGPPERRTVPVDDQPLFTPFPVWGMPGLLDGIQPCADFREEKAHVFHTIPPTIRKTLGLSPTDVADISYPEFRIDSKKFARAIAKMAYCQTVATLGLRGFRRLVLPDLILGHYPFVPYFVGGSLDPPPPPTPKDVKHVIGPIRITGGPLNLIVAHVRLFSSSGTNDHGSPVYYVVCGAPLPNYQPR